MTWLTSEDRDEVLKAIDAHAWKHSWHLPRDRNGYIDWYSDETLSKCRKVLEDYRTSSLMFAAKCDELVKKIAQVETERLKDETE